MRKDFVANASHELRSPLTVISGYLETLTSDPGVDPAIAGPLQEMRRQALRMTGIVQDLLDLSRLEASDRPAPSEPIDMVALMAQLRRDVLARSVHPAQVQMRADSDCEAARRGRADPFGLRQPGRQRCQVHPAGRARCRCAGGPTSRAGIFRSSIPASVSPPDHIPRLTERFYRVDSGRSRETGGSGTGTRDRQARAAAAWRAALDRESGRPRQQLHLPFSERSASNAPPEPAGHCDAVRALPAPLALYSGA